MNCPKCDADIGETFEPADFSVGIMSGGWYCDACDFAVGEDEVGREYHDDDVIVGPASRDASKPLGTPLSELRGQPGPKDDIGHPDHARYAEFCRIGRSWGYD
jgi:hypothetical protein